MNFKSVFAFAGRETQLLKQLAQTQLQIVGITASATQQPGTPFPFVVAPQTECMIEKRHLLHDHCIGGSSLSGAGTSEDKAWADLGRRLEQARKENDVVIITNPSLRNRDGYATVFQFNRLGALEPWKVMQADGIYRPVAQVHTVNSPAEIQSVLERIFSPAP